MKNKFYILLFAGLLMTSCSEDVSLLESKTDEVTISVDQQLLKPEKLNLQLKGKKVTRPMKVKGSGDIAFLYPCGENKFYVEITGKGTATHLGKFDLFLSYCRSFNPTNPGTKPEGYQMAANGDKLLTRMLYDGMEDGLYFQMYEYYPGGTGRFSEAEGWVQLFFEFTYNEGGIPVAYTNHGEGELTY